MSAVTSTDLQNLIEDLCRQHPDVAHEQGGQRAFARLGSDAHINEIRTNGGPNIVCVASIGGRRVGEKDDQQLRRDLVLRFACYAAAEGDRQANRDNAIALAEKIMLDFVKRLEHLYDLYFDGGDVDCSSVIRFLELEKINWTEIEEQPWLTHHYGWDLSLPFKSYLPEYDGTLWGDAAGGGLSNAYPQFNLITAPTSSDTIVVSIIPNGAPKYLVNIYESGSNQVLQSKEVVVQQGVPPGAGFTGLYNGYPYQVEVMAYTAAGYVPGGDRKQIFTPGAPGCEVVILTPQANKLRVYWHGNNQSYVRKVSLFSDDQGSNELATETVHAGAVGYEVWFNNLDPDTDYWVRVQPTDRNTVGNDDLCPLHQTHTLP